MATRNDAEWMAHMRVLSHETARQKVAQKLAEGRKTCPRCEETKPLDGFAPVPSRPDGLDGWCKICRAASTRAWQQRQEEARLNRRRELQERLAKAKKKPSAGGLWEDAACAGMGDTEAGLSLFFSPRRAVEAAWLCAECAIRVQCGAWADKNHEQGLWGGKFRPLGRVRH